MNSTLSACRLRALALACAVTCTVSGGFLHAQESETKSPYQVTLSAARSSLFAHQALVITVKVENTGAEAGPEFTRSALMGPKSFVVAKPVPGGSDWVGEYASTEGEIAAGSIGPLLPGESFSTKATLRIPDGMSEGANALYMEWRGRESLEGLSGNQLVLNVQNSNSPVATLETSEGTIVLELWPDRAPNHVANFVTLARKNYYKDLLFHRVIRGFMVQTGDPKGTGGGGPGYTIPDEFNQTDFKKGVLGMAKTGAPNSAGSQFFICVGDQPSLNEKYTAFGRVLEGQDVADRISQVPTQPSGPQKDRPLTPVILKSIRVDVPKGYELPEIKKT